MENPTWFLSKEIHSPAAFNHLNKLSTGLYSQPRETEWVSFFMSRYNPLTHDLNKIIYLCKLQKILGRAPLNSQDFFAGFWDGVS